MSFEPQNELEMDLVRAANDPVHRPGFLRELLDAPIYLALLLADGSRLETGRGGQAVIPDGARLELGAVERGGAGAVPFFSAPARAQEFYQRDHVVAPDKGRDLFARHPATPFVMNPGSDYAVDLSPGDIDAMLRGDFTAH